MFIAREQELNTLDSLYKKDGFGMVIISGRRRIGKSTLISKFITGKRAIFYTATKVGKERNLDLFTEQVVSVLDPAFENARFLSTEAIFDFIEKKITKEKLILVIDELPYWAEKDEALLSVMQKYIDTCWSEKNLLIILCGSALSFMENKVLSEKSPLFGRRSTQIRLTEFNYRDSALFVPKFSDEEKAICYGITGGVAKYLSLFDDGISLDENIRRQFFRTDGYLYDETKNLLIQEFTDITLVNNIIEQIAFGENTVNGIATKLGDSTQTILYSLNRLMDVGLVEKRRCITEEKNKKKTQYILKDSMFKFWYEFIPKATSVIEMNRGEMYFDKIVKEKIHSFMGSIFEEMCRYYTLERGILGDFGGFMTGVGTWWGMESVLDQAGTCIQQSADIDVVAISEIDKTAVIGECKFKNEKIDKGVYEKTMERAGLIRGKYKVKKVLFFSLSGYTDWVYDHLDDDVILLTLGDLYH